MKRTPTALTLLLLLLTACGGTWVDDKHNFERAFNYQRPPGVQVPHSIYWQSPHFTDEHCYYLELVPGTNTALLSTLKTFPNLVPEAAEAVQKELSGGLAIKRPDWFAPGPLTSYEIWATTNIFEPFAILRNKTNGTLFVYGQLL